MRRKRYTERNQEKIQGQFVWFAAGLAAVCVLMMLVIAVCQIGKMQSLKRQNAEKEVMEEIATAEPQKTPSPTPEPTKDPAEGVYTFLQGPKSWKRGISWSGEWGEKAMDGGYFGAFGCGLCCMANIYSSLTPYQSSPINMYQYAKKNTAYRGGMAIEWGYMRQSLTKLGFDCQVKKKPGNYEQFVQDIQKAEASIVLVSSRDSDVYWENTPGHYVTLFLYDKEKENVLLADSGNPSHNRQRVGLKKIYRSLKTRSNWQYLLVDRYDKQKDKWRNKTADGNWVVPDYLSKEKK